MGLGVLFFDEVDVVGADELDAVFACQFDEHAVGLLLQGEGLAVGPLPRVFHLVALQLEVVVVAEHAVVPLNGLAGSGDVALKDFLGYLASDAGRADDESLVVTLEIGAVGTRTHVVAVYPCARDELDEVLVALVVLGQHNEVVAALVFAAVLLLLGAMLGHIHLAAEDGLEGFLARLLALFVDADTVVVELLDAEHVAVVGDSHAPHAVGNGLVDEFRNLGLAVQDGIVCMYVQMNEIFHNRQRYEKLTDAASILRTLTSCSLQKRRKTARI